jgi:uncharacterized membrane protein HdeD (DUF308 family)
MKKKVAIFYKVHYWASFTINVTFAYIVNLLKTDKKIPFYIIVLVAMTIAPKGVLRIFHDVNVRDFSVSTILLDYSIVLIVSGILVYFLFDNYMEYYALQLLIICIIEILIFPLIYYRQKVKSKLKKLFCKK